MITLYFSKFAIASEVASSMISTIFLATAGLSSMNLVVNTAARSKTDQRSLPATGFITARSAPSVAAAIDPTGSSDNVASTLPPILPELKLWDGEIHKLHLLIRVEAGGTTS